MCFHKIHGQLWQSGAVLFETSWMSDREQLIAIEPRVIEQYQLSLSREELGRLALLLCVPAGVLALMGLLSALLRRY